MTQPDEDPQYQFWVNGIIIPHDVLLSQEDVWKSVSYTHLKRDEEPGFRYG